MNGPASMKWKLPVPFKHHRDRAASTKKDREALEADTEGRKRFLDELEELDSTLRGEEKHA